MPACAILNSQKKSAFSPFVHPVRPPSKTPATGEVELAARKALLWIIGESKVTSVELACAC